MLPLSLLLILLSAVHVLPFTLAPCACRPLSACRPDTQLLIYRRMRRIHRKGQNATIEISIELAMKEKNSNNLADFDLLTNESSIVIDWLPFSHDVVVMNRKPPRLKAINYIRRDNSLSLVATLEFDEINMQLRSTYEIRIKSLYHRECKKIIDLNPPVGLNVTFACERIKDASCTDSIKVDHHPVCQVMQSFHTNIHTVQEEERNAEVKFKLDERRLSQLEKARYAIVYYGECQGNPRTKRPVEPDCVLSLKSTHRKRFCLPRQNCSFESFYNFTITNLNETRYGAQVCFVLDKRFELPPLLRTDGRIGAEHMFTPPKIHRLPSWKDPLVRTIVSYTLLISILVMFMFTVLMYKCVTGRGFHNKKEKKEKGDAWEIDEQHIEIHSDMKVGNGRYGKVLLGTLSPECNVQGLSMLLLNDHRQVAVKSTPLTDKISRKALFDEIEGAKLVGRNPRICSLIGVVHTEDHIQMVLEYCPNQTLKKYLDSRRKYMAQLQSDGIDLNSSMVNINDINLEMILSAQDIYDMINQVSAGMVYLSSQALVHGSLCSKHILMTYDYSIKISDFNMTQKESSGFRFPVQEHLIKSTALEVLKGEPATRKSDVWSFGVLLWELITIGGVPYHNLQPSHIQGMLERGYRLQKPDICTAEMYTIIRNCWHHFANQRPSFSVLQEKLKVLLTLDGPAANRFVEVDGTCDFYVDSPSSSSSEGSPSAHDEERPDEELPPPPPELARRHSELLSESERLLGFRD